MSNHITKAFDADLQDLNRMVAEMGGLAEREIADCVQALTRRDSALARKLIATDSQIDALQRDIEERAVLTIARRQPMAVDLRDVVGALRVANEIERIGDLAKNIGKRVLDLNGEYPSLKLIRGVEHMGSLVLTQLKRVLDAYAARNVEEAMEVWRARRGNRCDVRVAVPRIADLHDGRPAQHHLLHPSAVFGEEYRAHG